MIIEQRHVELLSGDSDCHIILTADILTLKKCHNEGLRVEMLMELV
jgi:hypothetical protein